MKCLKMLLVILCVMFSFFWGVLWVEAKDGSLANNTLKDVQIGGKQIVEINKSLKNVIEENQRLADKNRTLQKNLDQLKKVQGEQERNLDSVKKDRNGFKEKVHKIRTLNRKYSKELKTLKRDVVKLRTSQQEYDQKLKMMEEEASVDEVINEPSVEEVQLAERLSMEKVKEREFRTMDLLSKIDAFTEQDERLRSDSAKAHYNMGNIYFQTGQYEIAAREYYQAVALLPDDPDVHYNLAFVSGEYLEDYKTALKHYQLYIYLSPRASDIALVREKIMHAKMAIRSRIDSPIEPISME